MRNIVFRFAFFIIFSFFYAFWVLFVNFLLILQCEYCINMIEVKIKDSELSKAAEEGIDAFLDLIIDKTREAIGGELSAENMPRMSSDQITLIGYATLRDEVMDGGFIQLIHNGYGPFFFRNLFDVAMREWGIVELTKLMRKAKKLYVRHMDDIETELTDEEFMALYEKLEGFDDLDDEFVSNEEEWSNKVAYYVDEKLDKFITIFK